MLDKGYPPLGFYFSLSFEAIDTDVDSAFQEVSGLTVERETDTIGEGGQNLYKYKVPKAAKYSNLILKRGMVAESSDLALWFRQTMGADLSAPIVPQQVFLSLLNDQGGLLAFWSFEQAWPVKWSVSDFKAQDSAIVIETLELAYTRFQQQKVPKQP